MSFSFKLKSHPTKLLIKHLENVGRLSEETVNSKYFINKDIFSNIAYLIGISHDFGKSTSYFQDMLLETSNERSKYTYHSFISSLFGYYLTKKFLKNEGILDEFWYLPSIAWIVINKHHGNIRDIKESEILKLKEINKLETIKKQVDNLINNSFVEVEAIYKQLLPDLDIRLFLDTFSNITNFTNEIYTNTKKICRKKELKYYFYILFFYSVLLDADKLDASGLERIPEKIGYIEKDSVNLYKNAKFKGECKEGINEIREMAYNEVNSQISNLELEKDRILSMNLPTGLGKTLTGFSFALNLRDEVKSQFGFYPKIIYSLPFLSIIDQNSSIVAEILANENGIDWNELFKLTKAEKNNILEQKTPSNLLLKHHHLADIKYNEKIENEMNIIEDINQSLLLTEGWHSEIVITTFVQFFHSLITNKNRSARKFHNIINSVIILDEIQSVPHKYWLLINKMLKFLSSEFNCWIILMTATKPLLFSDEEAKELVIKKEKYFEAFDRVNFNFNLTEKDFENFKEEIFSKIVDEQNKDIMVVLNTIKSSKDLYNYLKLELSRKYGIEFEKNIDEDGICIFNGLELINMSTHVLPSFRLNRINRIKEDKKRKIIITTQLVEAGVDISVDVIYRDLAPLDSIIQTAGRCNRNNESEKGTVNIITLTNDNNVPFYKYIYESTLIDITKEVIKDMGSNISEKDFTLDAANRYYVLLKDRTSDAESMKIINHLLKLEFSYVYKNFKLIENYLQSVSIFVEINVEAKKVKKQIDSLFKTGSLERREKFLELRRSINLFTISINSNKNLAEKMRILPSFGKNDDFKYLPYNSLVDWYKLDIGFWPPEK